MTDPTLRPTSSHSGEKDYAEFERFSGRCEKVFGLRICTVFAWSPGDSDCIRVWSNHPEAYPFPARKPMGTTQWGNAVLHRKEPWEALTFPEVKKAFFDHPIISSLGCGCCLSAPVLESGLVIGAASILDVEGRYVSGDAQLFRDLTPMLVSSIKRA